MSQTYDGPNRSFESNEAIAQFLRVYLTSGKIAVAGAGEKSLGTALQPSFAAGEHQAVRLRNGPGTRFMVANGAISAGARCYGAASGKISATPGGQFEGIALEAATANNDVIEVYYDGEDPFADVATVAAAGSAQGDAAALTAGVNVVTGADATKGVILPAAVAGLTIEVYNAVAANGLKVYPATGDDINDGSANAAVTIEGKTLARFVALDTSTWAAQFTADT